MIVFNNLLKLRDDYVSTSVVKLHLNCCSMFSLKGFFPKFVLKFSVQNDTLHIFIRKQYLQQLLFFLKKHMVTRYEILSEIIALDTLKPQARFKLTYSLLSPLFSSRALVSYKIAELDTAPSCIYFFSNATWAEREVYDMFGVRFHRNPDLRRILTDYGFTGHPLRKDFPLTGFEEVYYNDSEKNICHTRVSLAQEFRVFQFQHPWS